MSNKPKATEATTEATTEVNNIVKQDTFAINGELNAIERTLGYFQEVLTAMHEAGFKPTISVFQGIIYDKFRATKGRGQGNAMSDYLKSETVKATPAINNLPIIDAAKLAMIQLPAGCEKVLNIYNYTLPTSNEILGKVFSVDIDETGKVYIPDSIKQAITDKHTQYGDAETMETIKEYEAIAEKLKELDAKIQTRSLVLTSQMLGQNAMTGEYFVNRTGIAAAVKHKNSFDEKGNKKPTRREPSLDEVING